MAVTALASGGKDSLFSAWIAEQQGLPVDELLTLRPSDPESMMFHTPNLDLVALQAEAWGKRHRSVPIPAAGEAVEGTALRDALGSEGGWVIAGAIASSYQWARLQRVAYETGRRVFTPLWGKAPRVVVEAEIAAGLDIRLVHLAAEPLTGELLGRRLDRALLEEIDRRARTHRPVHLAGEGGEYESLVVDAPFFAARLVLDRTEVESHGSATRLNVVAAHLEPKQGLGGPRAP